MSSKYKAIYRLARIVLFNIVEKVKWRNSVNENKKLILDAAKRGEEVSLKGIIVPDGFDANFKTTSILFSSDVELVFLVERDAKGDELFDHLRKSVRVRGFIREDKKGKRTIRITDFEVLEGGR